MSGKVREEVGNEAIDFAVVNLINKTNPALVKSMMTENDGYFNFDDVPFGSYRIKISFIGFESRIIEDIVINKENSMRNLGTIKLKQANTTLDEVVITSTKSPIEFNGDTITFNVSQNLMAAGSTASDLLKSVPMVSVDIDGKPTIAGKVNTRIFIDGKASDYTASTIVDLLNVLPSDAIEKMEVITNPDVKYSADGDGIINIVLKKGYKIGLNGALSLTGSTLGNYNTNLYTAYRTETLSLSTSYGFRDHNNNSKMTSLRSNFNPSGNISSYMNQISEAETGNGGHNARASVDWDITKKQNLRVSANFNTSGSNGASHLDDHRLNSSAVEQELRVQDNVNGSNSVNGVFNADYQYKIGKQNETLTAGLTWFKEDQSRERDLSRIYLKQGGYVSNEFSQQNENDIINRRFEFNLDYRKPISRFSSISVGVQSTLNKNSNDQLVHGFDFINKQDTLKPNLTNLFSYLENVYSAFGSYSIRTKSRWSFRAGVRAEYTDIEFLQDKISDISPGSYINLFPNFSINKLFNKKYNVGLSYSRRITRPREHALNPLIDDSNQSNVSFGNPGLLPSYTNQFQLSLGTYGKKWSLTPRIGYAITGRIIERFRISPDSVTYRNLATNKTLSYNVFGNYRPTKKITVSGGFSVSQVSYKSESTLQPDRNGFSYRGNGTLTGEFPYKISAEGQVNYFNYTLAQGSTKGSAQIALGLRKTFINNKLLVRVLATDPFSQRNVTEYVDGRTLSGATYKLDRSREQNTTNYSLTLSYRFTKVGRNTVNKQKADKEPEL
ncbi:MAG TPA: outer membrane beta-barrel protein [Sphingobacteriaceae bacterium]